MRAPHRVPCLLLLLSAWVVITPGTSAAPADLYPFNRAPLVAKPYTELPLGAIAARGWLHDELQRMAAGMSGHLDDWYPEVVGPRNAWLGGDGDTWERGPYWIDGLYPLARILHNDALIAKTMRWIDWTLEHQRDDGYIGPRPFDEKTPRQPPPRGAQVRDPDDWWPRMVMLKILQQHHGATGDARVLDVMRKYFRYQLATLPTAPLRAPPGGKGGSWWAEQRGADNLMAVLWLYNITGESWLLPLADLIHQQTLPFTQIFLAGDVLKLRRGQAVAEFGQPSFHCVNLAQGIKSPLIRFQQDGDPRHLAAIRKAFTDIDVLHGQPHGLYGADEGMHGRRLDRGSELCTAVEMMFSLEKMVEISGDVAFADRLEKIAFNPLPTQVTDDHRYRQYFQQANQVQVTDDERPFYNSDGGRLVYGLLTGYPCCTCNYHQGWPKFTQHLWLATADRGLAALVFAPSQVKARVGSGQEVTITEETNYPFEETIRFRIASAAPVAFPLHVRIPSWCAQATLTINGAEPRTERGGRVVVVARAWRHDDVVELSLPMKIRSSRWDENSATVERGPLVYALRLEETWSETTRPAPADASPGVHRGYLECRPAGAWNYALLRSALDQPETGFAVHRTGARAANPWSLEGAPLELRTKAVRVAQWGLVQFSAGVLPLSPLMMPAHAAAESIRLVPYGCTTLRISGFPWIDDVRKPRRE